MPRAIDAAAADPNDLLCAMAERCHDATAFTQMLDHDVARWCRDPCAGGEAGDDVHAGGRVGGGGEVGVVAECVLD